MPGKIAAERKTLEDAFAKREAEYQAKITALSAEKDAFAAALPERIEREVTPREAELAARAEKIAAFEKEVDTLTRTAAAWEKENLFLHQETERLKAEAQAAAAPVLDQLEAYKKEADEKLRAVYDQLDQKERDLRQIQGELAEAKARIESMTRESDELARDYFEIVDKNVELRDRVKELEDYIDQKKAQP